MSKANNSESGVMSTFQRYLALFIIASATGIIYKVTYLREIFYDTMLDAFSISHAQLGLTSSVVGIVGMLCFVPGGFIADKYKPRNLLAFSLVASGLLTFWYATIPSYTELLILIGLLTVTTTLTFWASFVKAIRILGGKDEQGKFFGLSEGIRSFSGLVISFGALAFVELATTAAGGFQTALVFYGVIYTAMGILTYFLLPNTEDDEESEPALTIEGVKHIVTMPGVWLVALVVFSAYCVYSLQSYTTPYMQNVWGIPTALVGVVAIIRQYGIGMLASPIAGTFADKIGSPTKTVLFGMILMAFVAAGFLFLPASASYWLVIVMVVALAFVVYSIRGIQYATMDEANIPMGTTGAAVGLISVIGFSPDVYIFAQVGGWLDKYPVEQAYDMIFAYMLVMIGVGIAASMGILRLAKKAEATKSMEAATA